MTSEAYLKWAWLEPEDSENMGKYFPSTYLEFSAILLYYNYS